MMEIDIEKLTKLKALRDKGLKIAWAYGLGVDSTAGLVLCHLLGLTPTWILFADVGNEKKETYAYLPIIQEWLAKVGFPPVTTVKYQVKRFKHYPPYHSLGENSFTNGTLPGLAFGRKSCSLKWKVQPQDSYMKEQPLAQAEWAAGRLIAKMIGYDNSSKDRKRYAHAVDKQDPGYDYYYPLIEAGLDRDLCKELIRSVGLPVPPKSACIFCPATQPAELREFRKEYLRYIVVMEARAAPRLDGLKKQDQLDAEFAVRHRKWFEKQGELRLKYNLPPLPAVGLASEPTIVSVEEWQEGWPEVVRVHLLEQPKRRMEGSGTAGLWRSATKKKPAMMTDFIRNEKLLPADEIADLIARVPQEIIDNQAKFANGEDIPNWHDFLEQFTEEDALDEVPGAKACTGCTMS